MNSEKSIQKKIIDVAVAMSSSGLSPGRSGNVSARFESGFLITPSGLSYDSLDIRDVVFVDENGACSKGSPLPSSEWRFHHDVYQQRPEIDGIVHCHARHATALACCNKEIPAFHYMVAAAGGQNIPLASYALFGTQQLSDNILEALACCEDAPAGYRAALMEHHGLIALGGDVEAAFDLAGEVEDLAAQYVLVLGLGGDRTLSSEQMQEVVERFKTYGKQEQQ